MRILYDVLFSFFAIFYMPIFILKGKGRGGMGSRLGRVPEEIVLKLNGRKTIWIHAVSVGEVSLAIRILNHWRKIFTGARFVLTVTTVAGYEVALKSKNQDDVLLQFPADFRFSVRRFIQSVNPSAVVMMETEIWPNLIWELAAKKIPFFILNGRISDRAIGKYRRVRFFIAPLLKLFSAIGAQDELMRDRFIELGGRPENVRVTGNLKFDWEPSAKEPADAADAVRKISSASKFLMIAASTHEGEDDVLMDVFLSLADAIPGFQLLLAPRHLERIPGIETLAAKKGIRLKKVFTEANNGYDDSTKSVWLLDRMGVLQYLYAAADTVFVGGSLVPIGGHNPVEPAYYAKPVLFGPRMDNFLEMSRIFLAGGAAFEVMNAEDIKSRVLALAKDDRQRHLMGQKAKQIIVSHQGALEKNTEVFFQSTGDIWK